VSILERAGRDPDGWALDDGVRRRSWAELVDRAGRLGHVLRDDLGLVPGDHVASLQGNRVEFFELALAAMFTGVWLVPVNTHLTDDEVSYVLADSGARAVLADPAHLEAARRVAQVPVVAVGDDLDRLVASASDAPWPLEGPTGGRMHYTSGTTGRPKGAKRSLPGSVAAYLELLGRLGRSVGLDGSGPHLLTGPHYHAAVGGYALFDLVNGAPVAMLPRFTPEAVLAAIAEHRIEHTHLVPTMFVRLLRLPDEARATFDPSSLRHVLHGAAPIAPAVKRRMIEWWGPVLVEYWGASEAGTFTLIDSHEWLAHPGSVGRPMPGVTVEALDDDGRPVPTDEVGTLWCRMGDAPDPFRYHGDADKTARTFAAPGLFSLGDMGRIDAEGYVYLTDRATNMIISGGVNVYPAEVEAVLAEHPAVVDVAVFGVPDDEWGESVKAAVELAPGYEPSEALAADLVAFARRHLAGYKAPRSVDFEERLPRTPAGKLQVGVLKDRYWQGRERRI
jgi:long-chain acyl-CoA synthetase